MKIASASDYTTTQLAALMSEAFSDYLIDTGTIDREHFENLVHVNGVDLRASCVAVLDDQPAGLGLTALRPGACRLAAMGVVPAARSRGVGAQMMEHLLTAAGQRGDETMGLEVFAQNEPAVNLYRRFGFSILEQLLGFRHAAVGTSGAATGEIEETPVAEVARQLQQHGSPDLPWQVAGPNIARMGNTCRGYRLGPASLVVSDSKRGPWVLRALVVPPEARRQGHARALVRGLMARFPRVPWRVLPVCPEVPGGALFQRLGFERERLYQLHMRRSLG